jgi:hypothetical protein
MKSLTKLRLRTAIFLVPMIACVAISMPAAANEFAVSVGGVFPNYHWTVSADGGTAQSNPPLLLIRGQTYSFDVSGLGGIHSFYIKTASITGAADAYAGGGLSANGISVDTAPGSPITFTVPMDAPNTLFYNCGLHSTMAGMISIDGIFTDGFEGP